MHKGRTTALFVCATVCVAIAWVSWQWFMATGKESAESTFQFNCASKLRTIGQGVTLFTADHQSHFPGTIEELQFAYDIKPDVYICQSSNDTPATGPTTQTVIADMAKGGHCSYIYAARGLTTATVTPMTVIAYEPLSHHGNGANVLFGDGHVEFLATTQFNAALATIRPTTMPADPS